MTPLLLAAWKRFRPEAPEAFVRVLKLVSIVTFRYSVVSARNPNALEPVYHAAAKAVLDGRAVSPREIFAQLRSIYVDDDGFRSNFTQLTMHARGQGRKLAKYILCRLEADARSGPCDHETDPGTIEHILPQNPTDDWTAGFPPRRWEAAADRLGNLTLLESGIGRDIGNASFARKCPAYASSGYTLTKRIPEIAPEEWTFALLETRQQVLARRAAHTLARGLRG